MTNDKQVKAPVGTIVLLIVAGLLYVAMAGSLADLGGSDAAGRGMAIGFGMIFGAALWLVLALLLLIAALNGVLAQFSDCIDPVNGCALLTPRTSQVHEAVVELINSDSFCGAALGWRGVWHCGPTPRMLQAVSVRHGHAALCWTVVANRAPCQRPGF